MRQLSSKGASEIGSVASLPCRRDMFAMWSFHIMLRQLLLFAFARRL